MEASGLLILVPGAITPTTSAKQPGIGLQTCVANLDRNGWKHIIYAGKSGTNILWSEGK